MTTRTSSDRKKIVWTACGFLVVVVSVVVLAIWHPHGKDAPTMWGVIATFGLLGATGVLAIFTYLSVRQSARVADAAVEDAKRGSELIAIAQKQLAAAQRQSEIAQATLDAERQPVLVPAAPDGPYDPKAVVSFAYKGTRSKRFQDFPIALSVADDQAGWFFLKVRNVGKGPAVIGQEDGDLFLHSAGTGSIYGDTASRIIAPGDEMAWVFRGPDGSGAFLGTISALETTVCVNYSDLTYNRKFRGRFTFDKKRPRPTLVKATIEDLNF